MKKSMAFIFDEFDALVAEVTYGVVGFYYDAFSGYHYTTTMNDEEWDEWLENHDEEAEKEVRKYWGEEDEFVIAMIGKKFGMTVEHIIVDYFKDMVAVIFE